MSLLKETLRILNLEDKKSEKRFFTKPIRPFPEIHPFTFNLFNIPNVRSVKSTRERLSKVLAFIDMKKQVRFTDGYTVMHIPTVNKRLLSMCGSQKNVSRLLDYMIQIGLLADYDQSYQFNGYYQRNSKSKSYVYSYETEIIIKEYCSKNDINKYVIKNNQLSYHTIVDKFASFEPSEVRFSSKVYFMKPDNMSTAKFEEYLTTCLYENYPHLHHYQDLADYINETFYNEDPDRQIQFRPNFTWSKGNKAVRKIGIRATNSLVSCKKSKEEEDDENILYRDEVLNKYNLSYEFDVKSSVPRVTYLLNRGVWLDNKVDLYKSMYEHFIKICPSEKMDWNTETREIFKTFHMRGYFDTYSKVAAHIKHAISKKIDYKKEEWSNLDYVMKSYKMSIEETVGSLKYDSEIFFHESCIYMDVLKCLLERDYNVLQIYDGFYLDRECLDIEEIVRMLSEKYYQDCMYGSKYEYHSNVDIDTDRDNDNDIDTDSDTDTTISNQLSYHTIVDKFELTHTDIQTHELRPP